MAQMVRANPNLALAECARRRTDAIVSLLGVPELPMLGNSWPNMAGRHCDRG